MDNDESSGLLAAPDVQLTATETRHCDSIVADVLGRKEPAPIVSTDPIPAFVFLRYLITERQYLLHGSNRHNIDEFRPRRQTDYVGQMVSAVFAAEDDIAPMFYAVLDRGRYKGPMRNAFERVVDANGQARHRYSFSIDADSLVQSPWIEGMVYAFERTTQHRAIA